MKILNVIYNKGRGGLEQMYLSHSDMMRELGHTVVALLPRDSLVEADLHTRNIDIHYNASITNSLSHLNPLSVRALRKTFHSISPDIIILHNFRSLALVNKAAKGMCPVVAVHHGGNTKRLRSHSGPVLCVAKYMVAALHQMGIEKNRLYHLPNSIVVNTPYRGKTLQPEVPITIGSIGRLSHEKGMDIFIEALASLEIPYRGIIAGDGPLKDTLQKQAKHLDANIDFWGWVDAKGKEQFFQQCDLFVIASRHEPFGLTILESWAHSCPVLSTNTLGGQELIDHKRTGWLIESGTPPCMAEGISDFMRTNNTSNITNTAYDHLIDNYTYPNVKEQFSLILKQIAKY